MYPELWATRSPAGARWAQRRFVSVAAVCPPHWSASPLRTMALSYFSAGAQRAPNDCWLNEYGSEGMNDACTAGWTPQAQ